MADEVKNTDDCTRGLTNPEKGSSKGMETLNVTSNYSTAVSISENWENRVSHRLKDSDSQQDSKSPLELQAENNQNCSSEHGDMGSDTNPEPVDETEMQRHLNDVESSFVPILSPLFSDRKKGTDDTYLFDEALQISRLSATRDKNEVCHSGSRTSTAQYVSETDKLSVNSDEITSSTGINSSSPAAAAAMRSTCRNSSIFNHTKSSFVKTTNYTSESSQFENCNPENEIKHKLKETREDTQSINERLVSQYGNAKQNPDEAGGAENASKGSLMIPKRPSKRFKFLRNRHASHHASLSSLDGAEAVAGLDCTLQPETVMPVDEYSRQSSTTLSRSLSLGSMASGFDDSTDDIARSAHASLETLTEEKKLSEEASPPDTPRVRRRELSAPTDTVIARHVRNVHVPEAVVKEYQSKNGITAPSQLSNLQGPATNRMKKNLTLKEQSSTIERLSKENFDLKLKVMFLSDRLDKLSEEGSKDMISENIELKTGLAVIQRDNKALRRKVKELEKQLKAEEDRPSTPHSNTSNDEIPKWFDDENAQEREEELTYLREKVEEYATEIEKLRSDAAFKENDRRNLAEVVRQMGERKNQDVEAREEIDVWKELFEQETMRCEQVDTENKGLREEITRLKSEVIQNSSVPGLNHTTNDFNLTKRHQLSPSVPQSGISEQWEDRNGTASVSNTLVEELRTESELLKHENAKLRREVGAQTSMLTSRNREKDRLYQEIEDLKLRQRRGSVTGDCNVDCSVSRSNQRPISRSSGITRQTTVDDNEREDYENKNAELRDGINSIKIQNQDLRRELESCMADFETAVSQKKKSELLASEMREALEAAESDILTLQVERDEALHGQEEAEMMFESVKKEAQQELDSMSLDLDEASNEIERLQVELCDTTENFISLQGEMREMSQALVRLEDDHDFNVKRIQELEKELEDANRELEQLEKNLVEANEKSSRLIVQQESCQGEIVFLREEQESDKIKIGNLEAAIKTAEQTIADERERVKDLSQILSNERSQREVLAGKEKQEVQQIINQLNRELSSAKEEAKRLRRKDVEAAEWKQKLVDLEEQLRTALGEINGTRSSFLQSIAKLHHELEDTVHDLDRAKESLAQKDRIIKERDELLESHALEARKLADILDKERQYHRNTKHQFETFQKTSLHAIRNISQQESRVAELEGGRQQDRRKILGLENQLKEQMAERNQLLLTLWKRLSDLCGSDWAHDNRLINGRALPSMESVTTMFPGFSRNILGAVKKIEMLFKDFTSKIRSVEKDLWKEYQTLESNLETRIKKLDYLEIISRGVFPSATGDNRPDIGKLREQNINNKDVTPFKHPNNIRVGSYKDGKTSPSISTGPRLKTTDKSRIPTIHHRTSSQEKNDQVYRSGNDIEPKNEIVKGYQGYYDPKWATRLHELEEKYKAEREARIIDRTAARQRLDEKDQDNKELSQEIERLKTKMHMGR